MTGDDDAWRRTLLELISGLAASIAAAHPGLRLEFVRLYSADGAPVGEVQPITGCAPITTPEKGAAAAEEPRPFRLERVMRAYLSRSGASSTSD